MGIKVGTEETVGPTYTPIDTMALGDNYVGKAGGAGTDEGIPVGGTPVLTMFRGDPDLGVRYMLLRLGP